MTSKINGIWCIGCLLAVVTVLGTHPVNCFGAQGIIDISEYDSPTGPTNVVVIQRSEKTHLESQIFDGFAGLFSTYGDTDSIFLTLQNWFVFIHQEIFKLGDRDQKIKGKIDETGPDSVFASDQDATAFVTGLNDISDLRCMLRVTRRGAAQHNQLLAHEQEGDFKRLAPPTTYKVVLINGKKYAMFGDVELKSFVKTPGRATDQDLGLLFYVFFKQGLAMVTNETIEVGGEVLPVVPAEFRVRTDKVTAAYFEKLIGTKLIPEISDETGPYRLRFKATLQQVLRGYENLLKVKGNPARIDPRKLKSVSQCELVPFKPVEFKLCEAELKPKTKVPFYKKLN